MLSSTASSTTPRVSERRGVGDTYFAVQGGKIQSRGSNACNSLNRCETSLPNSIPARGTMKATLRGPTHVRSKTPPANRRLCLPNRGHPHTSLEHIKLEPSRKNLLAN